MKLNRLEKDPNQINFVYWFVRAGVYWFFKIIWRLKINNRKGVPRTGPLIVAVNHRSAADPPLIGITVPRVVHFMAKEELFRFAPFAWLLGKLHARPLNRSGDISALKSALQILEEKGAMIVFPEGTRSKTDEFRKPKMGVGLLAKKTGAPILPTYIHNSGALGKFKRLSVTYGTVMDASKLDRYEDVAEAVMAEIGKLRERYRK